MPITQLMSKLSGKFESNSTTKRNTSAAALEQPPRRTGDSMDVSKSFEVVAEVVPSRPGSMCSVASSEANDVVAAEPDQQAPFEVLNARLSTSSSAALLASSFSGPMPSLSSTHSGPATERALRARGKAMMRTESGLSPIAATCSSPASLDLQHQLSLESSSSMVDALYGSLQQAQGTGPLASPRFTRCSTAPLPGSSRAAAGPAAAGGAAAPQEAAVPPKVAATQPAADASDADGAESDDELVHPVSPAAAAEDSAEHCHWEDGVIASWLQGIDHGELLHPVEEGDGEEEALAGPSCSRAAAAGLPGKSMPLPSPYSSLLYN